MKKFESEKEYPNLLQIIENINLGDIMLVKCELEGLEFYIETMDVSESDEEEDVVLIQETGIPRRIQEKVTKIPAESFDKLMKFVPILSKKLYEKIRNIHPKPNEVSLEVTLGFTMEGNIYIAKGSANSNLKVRLTW